MKCDSTRAETRFRLSAKRTSPFKSVGASVQSTTGSRVVHISGSNAGYTMFRGSVKGTGYPLHSPVSPSLPIRCVTVCHYISTELYLQRPLAQDTLNATRGQNMYWRPCHVTGCHSPACRKGSARIPELRDLWRTKWHWIGFSPSSSVSPFQYRSTSASYPFVHLLPMLCDFGDW